MDIYSKLEDLQEGKYLPPYLSNSGSFVPGVSTVAYSGAFWDKNEIFAAIDSLLSGKWMSSGENVFKFERAFSKKFNFTSSLMVNSGSSANLVMVAALKKFFGWRDGDEVIVSVVGFPTTTTALLANNLTPIFVDIDWRDLNWDLNAISKKIGPRTKAVFSSPVLGNVYDLDFLTDLCDKNSLILIADNCDSLGSKWSGKYLTDFAFASSCSFYPAHHITTMEGGMISSNDEEFIEICRSIAWWGRDCYCVGRQNLLHEGTCKRRFSAWLETIDEIIDHKYFFTNLGFNLKPLDLQGAIGLVQLSKFDEIHSRRRENYRILGKIFENIEGLRILNEIDEAETSWFGFPIVCSSSSIKRRLVACLESNKIQTRNYFAGNLLVHPAFRHLGDFRDFPVANKVLSNVFFLGTSPTISAEMMDYIKKVVKDYFAAK